MKSLPVFCLFVCLKDIFPTVKKKAVILPQTGAHWVHYRLSEDGWQSVTLHLSCATVRYLLFKQPGEERVQHNMADANLLPVESRDRGSKNEPQTLTSSTSTESLSAITLATPSQICGETSH